MVYKNIETRHGAVSYYDNEVQSEKPTLVLIHGNSCSSEVFYQQINSPLFSGVRIIAPDLPGHGRSLNAIDPTVTYCMEGYADVLSEVFELLSLNTIVIVGWSLGGHIGLEILLRYSDVAGIVITGTPPVSSKNITEGFHATDSVGLAGKADLTDEQLFQLATSISGENFATEFFADVKRTDGLAREIMFNKFIAGTGADQSELVSKIKTPIAILNGERDPFINTQFIDTIKIQNLWGGKQFIFENSGHTPFLDESEKFNDFLLKFYNSVNVY
ncbi:alpha/beta fold hydrolase [Providencia sp. SP181]|uniref:alpha/beta fold hydrolase n=1 Tax=Providencia sp. SP181 TaxID=3136277 RepID=UPI003D28B478